MANRTASFCIQVMKCVIMNVVELVAAEKRQTNVDKYIRSNLQNRQKNEIKREKGYGR